MALLTTGDFYNVTFRATTHASWSAMSPVPAIPSGLIDHIAGTTSVDLYVIDHTTGQFAFAGGTAYGYDDTMVSSASAAFTNLVFTSDQGLTLVFGKDGSGDVYVYDPVAGRVHTYDPGDVAALKAFLP